MRLSESNAKPCLSIVEREHLRPTGQFHELNEFITMEGTIHIKNKQEKDYWIDGALVDKVTTSAYDFRMYGREAYVHYKSGEVEEIPCVVVIEVLGTYKMEPMPIPTKEEENNGASAPGGREAEAPGQAV